MSYQATAPSGQKQAKSENSTTPNFSAGERLAFEHVGAALALMPFCSLEDLEQGAFSYAAQSFASSGIPVRESYLRGKAERWAVWWFRKHRDRRTPRPHSQYSEVKAQRGREVSKIRRGAKADLDGLRVQLGVLRGASTARIAAKIGKTARHARRLMGRTFPRLLVWIVGRTFGEGSLPSPTSSNASTPKELLPNVRLGQVTAGTAEDVAGIDELGAEIGELLRSHWAAHPIPPPNERP